MKKVLISIIVILAFGILFWVVAPDNKCNNSSCDNNNKPPAVVAVEQSKQKQAYIYDVRSAEEYKTKHVDSAINFDVELIKSGKYPDVSKDATIYVYCRSGNRSNQASLLLKQNGYTNVTDLGGLDELKSAGVL